MTFRDRLRALPSFPPGLSPFGVDLDDLGSAPDTPQGLFTTWFDDTVDAGLLAPHAMTLATAGADGAAHARTVVLKDVTDAGWWFAGHATSPKGRDLAANPHAALVFLWRELGRQVRVTGRAAPAGPEASAADFRARPEGSRAAGLVDRQSEPLGSPEEYRSAFADQLDRTRRDPDAVAPAWTAWTLDPAEVEFWQASDDKGQTRLRYRRDPSTTPTAWTKELLWP